MPVEIFPEQLRAALGVSALDPRERFSDLDSLIAKVLDNHAPAHAAEIARALEVEHDHITSPAGVRDRFRSGRPLPGAGYVSTRNGYTPPQ